MMKLRVTTVGDGLHHSEVVVSVATNEGSQNLVIDKRSLQDGSIHIGYPIKQDQNAYLVELPRETSNGSWRVWVDGSQLFDEPERIYA